MNEILESPYAKPGPEEPSHQFDDIRVAQLPKEKPPVSPIEGNSLVITPIVMPESKNASVQSLVRINEGKNGQPEEYVIRPTTGVESKGACLKAGVLGYCSTERKLDPQGVDSAANAGDLASATQALIISGGKRLRNVLPQSAELLEQTALRKMQNITDDTSDPLRPVVDLSTPREKPPESAKDEPAAPRSKESLKDAVNAVLKDEVIPVQSLSADLKGGFSQKTKVTSDLGSVETEVRIPKLEDMKQLQLLFFNINSFDTREVPEKLTQVAKNLELNARTARALELCLKDPDRQFQKACSMALVAKQLEGFGVKIDQVVWQKARQEDEQAAKNRQMPTEEFVRQRMEEYLAQKARERKGVQPANPVVVQEPGEGHTAAEREELLRLLPTLISKPDLERISELIESQENRLSF